VHEAAAVGEMDGVADLHQHADLGMQPPLVVGGVAVGSFAQQRAPCAALDAFHDQHGQSVGTAGKIVDRHHVGVLQLAGDGGLGDEGCGEIGALLVGAFDGDFAAQ